MSSSRAVGSGVADSELYNMVEERTKMKVSAVADARRARSVPRELEGLVVAGLALMRCGPIRGLVTQVTPWARRPSNKRMNLTVRPVTRLAGLGSAPHLPARWRTQGARPSRPAGYRGRSTHKIEICETLPKVGLR